ncbi:uncharacterized protein MELLADRAFT_109943 [Melampsora larici-populina 98AG31]|uniref:BTB domain-containing protein n=1 Tax=Melampsora larici-populina (strain 98AG31 / pathotype 3-4-7) TaxID=747676 RepID=F4RY49_MELLP|nr:uncharacterized protein MELLADRAFT_109943 [Melampsora larici-populina 98AG31]EGG02618.1 hypothetical protein MELLADRAFT_109943 [Melampsora larici-populina 98AG31]
MAAGQVEHRTLESRDNSFFWGDGLLIMEEASEAEQSKLVFKLGKSFLETYNNKKWSVRLCFGCGREGELKFFREVFLTPQSKPDQWREVTIGRAPEILKWFDDSSDYEALYFKVILLHQVFGGTVMIGLDRELDVLKKSMRRMRTTIDCFQPRSMDITRLVFHPKRGGIVKNLYVPSHILTKYEYFQLLHSQDFSETLQTDESLSLSEDPVPQDVGELFAEDSDDEWDIDEDPREPQKGDTFKATIHIRDTARRTYQAFLDYAFCGALYFAPLRSTYRQFQQECQVDILPFPPCGPPWPPAWPVWATSFSMSHTNVPGYKTITSPKSLYRLADMLIIPELKAICRKRVTHSLKVDTVVSEILSPMFQRHQELRMSAYEFVQKNWKSIVQKGDMSKIFINLSPEEAALLSETVFKNLITSPKTKS